MVVQDYQEHIIPEKTRAPEVENDTAKIKVRTSKRIDDIPITVEIMSDLVL